MHYKVTHELAYFNISPTYTQTEDIIKLRYALVVTHGRRNQATFQRNWPIGKGIESFETHSKFPVESKKPITKQDLSKLKI